VLTTGIKATPMKIATSGATNLSTSAMSSPFLNCLSLFKKKLDLY
jgi:hypothetical protein